MASTVCKNQPPKARKRIVVGLAASSTLKEVASSCNGMINSTTRCESCNKDIPAGAAGVDVLHDCVQHSNKASSVLVKSVSIAAKDAVQAKSTEIESKSRKRKADAVETACKPVKAKKEKDPNEPKRPPTAFFLFMEEFRQTYKKANPNAKGGTAVSKAGAEKWKSISDEAKESFVKKCADMKEEYQRAIKNYKSNGKELIESTITEINAEGRGDGVDESCEETAASADHTSEADQ